MPDPTPAAVVGAAPEYINTHDKVKACNTTQRLPITPKVKSTPECSSPGSTSPEDTTPLRRRFLSKVKVANMAPSPARTPPRTPSPDKGRLSPSKDLTGPTKENLEVGQGVFYFSCELPMSKVSPKKGTETGSSRATASKMEKSGGSRAGTPMATGKRIDQEVKSKGATPTGKKSMGAKGATPASKKTTSAKSGAPTGKKGMSAKVERPTTTPKKMGAGSRPPSPSKKNVMEGEAHDLVAKPTPTMPKKLPVRTLKKNGMGVEVETGSESLLGVKNVVPNKSVATSRALRHATTPKKTVLKEKSTDEMSTIESAQKVQKEKKDFAGKGNEEKDMATLPSPPGGSATHSTPTRTRRGPSFNMGDMMAGLKTSTPVASEQSGGEGMPTPLKKAAAKLHYTTPITKPKEAPQTKPAETPPPVLRQSPPVLARKPLHESATSKPARKKVTFQHSDQPSSKLPRPTISKPVGTDPVVVSTMRQEMAQLNESLGKTSVTKGSLGMNGGNEGQIGLQDFFYDSKEFDEGLVVSSVPGGVAGAMRKPKSSSPTKSGEMSKASTPQKKKHATPGPTYTPTHLHNSSAKDKRGGTLPQTTRTSMFNSPIRSRTKVSSPTHTSTPQPKPDKATAPQRKKDKDTSRPVFASAVDIATRVAEWNSADRLKDLKRAQKATTVTPTRMQRAGKVKKDIKLTGIDPPKTISTTPPGSPNKSAPKLPNNTKNLTPRRHAPKPPKSNTPASKHTPLPRNNKDPALTRLRGPSAPHTPASKKMSKSVGAMVNDPNAYRTPSKDIEKSLDEAIDRKLSEDRKNCH